ncbi:hypothetical protein ONZ45_g12756 [Pleurotus djamor]|nr:hypothetical protein ONZ45_g12756 [Pleurotus djamor]
MTLPLTPTLVFVLLTLPVLLRLLRSKSRTGLSLPPGPKRLPIIGNLLVMPKTYQWAKYAQWSKEYNSDIVYLEVLTNPTIVLNSLASVQEILMRRSALSADKPQSTMIKLIGWDWNIGLLPYGAIWRTRRRLFWQEFNPSNSFLHHPSQLKYARQFLKDLLDDPSQFARHCHYTPASSMIEVAFGCGVEPKDDPTIIIAEKALHHFNESAISGTYLVDSLPILQYLPTWLPGAAFLRYARIAYQDAMDLLNIPFMQAKERMIRGEISPCVVTRAYARHGQPYPEDLENERIIKEVSSMAYAGSADTSPPPLINFVAAMALFPSVQAKAQAELDRVLGH